MTMLNTLHITVPVATLLPAAAMAETKDAWISCTPSLFAIGHRVERPGVILKRQIASCLVDLTVPRPDAIT